MRPDICIYHAPCQDGFTAAWAIWKRWPDVEFVPGVYGQAPPDVAGKHVLIVDFSYKRPVLQEMGRSAASITILDHHKTAEADLAPFKVQFFYRSPETYVDEGLDGLSGPYPIQAHFDMEKSGAVLAWEYAHPGEPIPRLALHVQDRDLWRFELPNTREIAAAIFSHDYSFRQWDALANQLALIPDDVVLEGEAIERKHHKDIAELLRLCTREMVIGGYRVRVANLPYTLSSDGANALAKGQPFGACYYDNAEGKRVFSLRSQADGGIDVSAVAAAYGGGGHQHAAGFTAPRGWEGDL
ncbi:MAG TPA: hypothetical protein VL358_04705 [Caulobacteraceae bacterium]|jgi:oligoribonuclease NrnB/cAMP/cGMP phosphodiesterase (DHH superfamily)|nr:hypothetical protein [Caulobacteraceae bacterium]